MQDAGSRPAAVGQVEPSVRLRQPKLDDVASRIAAHLDRLEKDKAWNVRGDRGALRLWCSHAFRAGRYVAVRYISYQGTTNLTRDEALRYLAALDGGFKGRHFEALRKPKAA